MVRGSFDALESCNVVSNKDDGEQHSMRQCRWPRCRKDPSRVFEQGLLLQELGPCVSSKSPGTVFLLLFPQPYVVL